MDMFSVPGIMTHVKTNFTDTFNSQKKNGLKFLNENFGASSSEEMNMANTVFSSIVLFIAICIVVALYFWAIMILMSPQNFILSPVVKFLFILFMLLGQPMYSIILAYLFSNGQTPFQKIMGKI